jgi:hypothetical protein
MLFILLMTLEVASVLNKKIGIFVGVFFAGLLAAIPMRTCVIMFDIDPKTGFYNGGGSLVAALNILLLIVTVLLLVPSFIKSFRKLSAQPRHSAAAGFLLAAVAILFVIDAVNDFVGAANDMQALHVGELSELARSTLLNSMYGAAVNCVFGLAAAAFFALYSSASFKGRRIAMPVASKMPVLWAGVKLMSAFIRYTDIVKNSEYLYDMLKMVFVMIFLYYHARFTGKVSNGNELKGMLAFGLPAVFFSLVSILPRYIALALGRTAQAVNIGITSDLLFLGLAVYIATVLYAAFLSRSSKPVGDGGGDGKGLKVGDTQTAEE